jgi:hypothetical protein
MSHTTHIQSRSVVAALFAVAGLIATSTAHAQDITPERALLNSIPPAYSVIVVGNDVVTPVIDGDRALLGRFMLGTSIGSSTLARSTDGNLVITGERALLGYVAPTRDWRVKLSRK